MQAPEERDWRSADGSTIRAYEYGSAQAPPEQRVLVVCGAFLPARVYAPFAHALTAELGDDWSVTVYDRRGKGNSSPVDDSYSIDTELDDLTMALRESRARHLFGHSLGGSVVLHGVQHLAESDGELRALVPDTTTVYDPAINIEGSVDTSWVPEFRKRVDAGQLGRAMSLVERNLGMSRALTRAPTWMVAGVLAVATRTGLRGLTRSVFPAGAAELSEIFTVEATAAEFAGLPTRTTIMTGERSADYFQATALALAGAIPDSELLVSPKGIHGSVPIVKHSVVESLSRVLRDEPLGEFSLDRSHLSVAEG